MVKSADVPPWRRWPRTMYRHGDPGLQMARTSRLRRGLRATIAAATLTLTLLRVQSKEIPNNASKTASSSVFHKVNASFWNNNEVTLDEDSYYLGQSGYLRDSTSMLTYQVKSHTNRTTTGIKGHRRSKRGVTHLYNMIVCATGCNPLAYKGYGCYCGFLGSGRPMDGIDRCCKMHDWCYNVAECPMFVEYFVPYHWKCYRGYKPLCAIEHGEWGGSGSCAQRLCECDRAFAECLRRYRCPRHKAVCTSSPWRFIQNLFMII